MQLNFLYNRTVFWIAVSATAIIGISVIIFLARLGFSFLEARPITARDGIFAATGVCFTVLSAVASAVLRIAFDVQDRFNKTADAVDTHSKRLSDILLPIQAMNDLMGNKSFIVDEKPDQPAWRGFIGRYCGFNPTFRSDDRLGTGFVDEDRVEMHLDRYIQGVGHSDYFLYDGFWAQNCVEVRIMKTFIALIDAVTTKESQRSIKPGAASKISIFLIKGKRISESYFIGKKRNINGHAVDFTICYRATEETDLKHSVFAHHLIPTLLLVSTDTEFKKKLDRIVEAEFKPQDSPELTFEKFREAVVRHGQVGGDPFLSPDHRAVSQ
jgi:hypothetical protein